MSNRNEYSTLNTSDKENKSIFNIPKDKLIRYLLIIGVPVLVLLIIIIIIIVAVSSKKKEEEKKQEIDWEHLIPVPSAEEMKKLIQSATNITTALSQAQIQNILNNNKTPIVHFEKGTYNLVMKNMSGQGIGFMISRQMTMILDKGVVFNVTEEPFKIYDKYTAFRFNGIKATKEKPFNIFGTLEVNGNRNPQIDSQYGAEWGMGVMFYGCNYMNVQEINSYENHGDGVYIGTLTTANPDGSRTHNTGSNLNFGKISCKHSYRNGVSIISGTNIKINEIYSDKTNGTAPQSGIDVEPNYEDEKVDYIINKIYTQDNTMYGFVAGTKYSAYVHVEINELHSKDDCLSVSNGVNVYLVGTNDDSCLPNSSIYFNIHKAFVNYIEGRGYNVTKYIRTARWNKKCRKLDLGPVEIYKENKTFV